jgi:hypothetical protein
MIAYRKCFQCTLVFILFSFPLIRTVHAAQITLAWDANPDPVVAGYKLYYGYASLTYGMPIDVGNVSRYTLTGIAEGVPSYYAVTAYDASYNESSFSSELNCFTLVSSTGVNGSIIPAVPVLVSLGMNKSFAITPASNYKIVDVQVDSVSVGPVASYTFSNIDRCHSISATFAPYSQIGSFGSFNGDGQADLIWMNSATGQIYIMFMSGIYYSGGQLLISGADFNAWTIVGTNDFNSDGKPDILWRNALTGENYVCFMDGVTFTDGAYLPAVADPNWVVAGTGDFNNDGKADILWRNTSTGENVVLYLNGITVTGWTFLSTVPDTNWKIVGAGNFSSDDNTDILWRNALTGENYVCFMDGVTYSGGAYLPAIADPDWVIVGTGDFNSDGKADILWRTMSTGETFVWYMDGVTYIGEATLPQVADPNWVIVQ